LQITAALLTTDPALTADELAGDMAAEPQRLDLLTYDDGSQRSALSVSVAFGLSYRKLDDTAARMGMRLRDAYRLRQQDRSALPRLSRSRMCGTLIS
jgi:hypothetical protein